MMEATLKRKSCSKCNKDKLLSDFNKRTASKDGLQVYCKECFRQIDRNKQKAAKALRVAEVKKYNPVQKLLEAYSRSKILRLGVAYLESCHVGRSDLIAETGLSEGTLKRYSIIAQNYWPKEPKQYEEWTDAEDNYLMANYQVKELRKICEALPHRSRFSITKQAGILGVTRARQQY